MRTNFVWVLLITLFSFTACSKRESVEQQIIDDKATISVETDIVASHNDDNKIAIDHSKVKVNENLNFSQSDYSSSSNSFSPDDAYDEGFENGYEHGLEDGKKGRSHGYSYDESSSYYNHYETRYEEGYDEGYDDGYHHGQR